MDVCLIEKLTKYDLDWVLYRSWWSYTYIQWCYFYNGLNQTYSWEICFSCSNCLQL